MGKDPAFLFYPADFMMGTFGMTNEQVGMYIRLLCFMFDRGPMKEELCNQLVPGALDTYVIRDKFISYKDGTFFNTRLAKEIEKRALFCESRRASVMKRWHKDNKYIRNTNVIRMGNRNENENKRGVGGKHLFKNSPFFNYEGWKTNFPDWSPEKIRYYWEAANEYSESKGARYLNWVMTVKCWDRRHPDEWKKHKPMFQDD